MPEKTSFKYVLKKKNCFALYKTGKSIIKSIEQRHTVYASLQQLHIKMLYIAAVI
jgi:hypothetical protein